MCERGVHCSPCFLQVAAIRAALPPSAAPGALEPSASPAGPLDAGGEDEYDVRMSVVTDIEEELKGRARYARASGGEAYNEDDEVRLHAHAAGEACL